MKIFTTEIATRNDGQHTLWGLVDDYRYEEAREWFYTKGKEIGVRYPRRWVPLVVGALETCQKMLELYKNKNRATRHVARPNNPASA